MTLDEKTGQTLFISITGTTLTDQTKKLLDKVKPGGIILFTPNIQTEEQTQKLTADLQEWVENSDLPPLFIAVDEEGGVVERINFNPVQYSQPQLGQINKEETTRQTMSETAQTLSALGINTNFAPVADIAFSDKSIMADRAFGHTSALVSNHVGFAIEEYNEAKIFSTTKHFPGHGRTPADSHQILPEIDLSREDWDKNERIPFDTAIDSNVRFVMAGHLIYPQIDNNMTSTSSKWITEILRKDMEFKGIIIADDIKMGATGTNLSTTALKMLDAGNNMIIAVLDQDSLINIASDIEERYCEEEADKVLSTKILRILVLKYEISE